MVEVGLSEPQRALVSTISAGQEAIDTAHNLLNEKAKLPPLGNDPASLRWKETQWNTNQQAVQSQVSAMNAATAQMVRLIFFLENLITSTFSFYQTKGVKVLLGV